MQTIIGFTSDFGRDDTWVGVCRAAIYEACPQAHVVDFAHDIAPFDIRAGAAVAAAGVHQLPEAIHLVAIDPGVGGGRRDVCLVSHEGVRLVGPDNGVLVPAAERCGGIAEAIVLEHERITSAPILPTFHARDILAPAVAAIACGIVPGELGSPLDPSELVPGPFTLATVESRASAAEVIHADRFGSLRLNLTVERAAELGSPGSLLEVGLGHSTLHVRLGLTFSDVAPGEPVLLVDSSGWFTLAVNQGSALERYGAQPGTHARLKGADVTAGA